MGGGGWGVGNEESGISEFCLCLCLCCALCGYFVLDFIEYSVVVRYDMPVENALFFLRRKRGREVGKEWLWMWCMAILEPCSCECRLELSGVRWRSVVAFLELRLMGVMGKLVCQTITA